MNSLLDVLEGEESLLSNKQALSIFGQNFGLETDFDAFDELVSFYHQVETRLPGLNNRTIRNFLKTGDLDLLQSLPKIDDQPGLATLEEIAKEIQLRDTKHSNHCAVLNELESYSSSLKIPAEIPIESLLPLAERIDKHLELMGTLDSADRVKEILGAKFDGCNTAKSIVGREVLAAESIRSLNSHASVAIHALNAKKVPEAHTVLDEFILKNQAAASALNALSQRTGIDLASLAARATPETVGDYLLKAAQDKPGLYAHSNYETLLQDFRQRGFEWVVSCLLESGNTLHGLETVCEP